VLLAQRRAEDRLRLALLERGAGHS
jgi:hypothetical protein